MLKNNLFNLIKNELEKLFFQRYTTVLFLILIIFILGLGILMYAGEQVSNESKYTSSNWKTTLQKENDELIQESREDPIFENFNKDLIALNKYHIQNNVMPSGYSMWNFLKDNLISMSVINLIVIIVAATILSNEYKWGTIKLMLIRPFSRAEVLLVKFGSVILYGLLLLLASYLFSMLIGYLFFGFNNSPLIFYQNGEVKEALPFKHITGQYILSFANVVVTASLAFMLAVITKKSAVSIGLSVFLMFSGNAIVKSLAGESWAKYILYANTDLNAVIGGTSSNSDQTFFFSASVVLVYIVLFLSVSFTIFKIRDVKNS